MLLVVLLLASSTGAAAGRAGIDVVARTTIGDRVRLTLDLGGAGDRPPGPFSTTVDGAPRPSTAEPVVSDRLVAGIVVDASQAGRPVLQAGASGLANVVLGAPSAIRTTLVADTAPPALLAPLQPGPTGPLRALSGLRPGGDRRTSDAVDLVLRQFPADVAEPRVVVLFTTAPDAGDVPAAELAERLTAAGALLGVVTTAGDGRGAPAYWSAVAAATGGVAVEAPPADVPAAFERLVDGLRTRHLVTTPVPERLPATLTVRVETVDGPLTADVVLPAGPVPVGPRAVMHPALRVPVTLAGTVLALVTAALAVTAARRAGPRLPGQRHQRVSS